MRGPNHRAFSLFSFIVNYLNYKVFIFLQSNDSKFEIKKQEELCLDTCQKIRKIGGVLLWFYPLLYEASS
jgi:hypothetical protein